MPAQLPEIRKISSPVQLPWFRFLRASDELNPLIRQIYADTLQSGIEGGTNRQLRYGLRWPFISAANAWRSSTAIGQSVHAAGGPAPIRQFLQAWRLGMSRNISVFNYYGFRLWEGDRSKRAGSWLQDREGTWLFERLNDSDACRSLDDKLEFFEACQSLGLPTAQVFAERRTGQAPLWFGAKKLPQSDLFIKPSDEGCGVGVARWRYDSQAAAWTRGQYRFDANAMLNDPRVIDDYEVRKGSGTRLLIQPCVENHPSLEPFSPGALCTLRTITYRIGNNPARLFSSSLRMPTGNAEADNFALGGITAAVDEQGRLGQGWKKYAAAPTLRHPDTGIEIRGARLPGWREMVELGLRAHDGLAENSFIGWDIALAPDGPLLIEANTMWSVEHCQAAEDKPIGESEFMSIVSRIASENLNRKTARAN